MCCGSKRSALRNTAMPARVPATPRPVFQRAADGTRAPGAPGPNPAAAAAQVAAPGASLLVTLRYLQTPAIRVRGPVTGRRYDFSGARPDQTVDPGDAPGLARTGLFRRV